MTDAPHTTIIDEIVYSVDKETLFYANNIFLEEAKIPEGVKCIDAEAFESSFIKDIKFPDSLEIIKKNAFHDCQYLKDIYIKNDCTLAEFAFCHTLFLENIDIVCRKISDFCFKNSGNRGDGLNIVLHDTEYIGNNAFMDCLINNIVWPITLKTIDNRAFCEAEFAFPKLVLPEGLESIGEKVFYNTEGLTDVYIPSSVKYIGDLMAPSDIKFHMSKYTAERFFGNTTPPKHIIIEDDILTELIDTLSFKEINKRILEETVAK